MGAETELRYAGAVTTITSLTMNESSASQCDLFCFFPTG